MNLRALAESDLEVTLQDTQDGGATDFTFVDLAENEYPTTGILGDIGYLLTTEGVPIAGRTVCATWRMGALKDDSDKIIIPRRGWKLCYVDMYGTSWTLYITRVEPDRTIGIGRVYLSLDLQK